MWDQMNLDRGQVQDREIAVLADAVFSGLCRRSVKMVMQRQEENEEEDGGPNESTLGVV